MKNFKSHFVFNKEQRSGIFFLLVLIIIFQIIYSFVKTDFFNYSVNNLTYDKELQLNIDSLKQKSLEIKSVKVYPFNPNYITDYKGYVLGLSVTEIDRLHTFRAKNKYINSAIEFQKVTKVSDSLLNQISPYFKFPEWTKKKENNISNVDLSSFKNKTNKKERIVIKDINTATVQDLQAIKGIGVTLSTRIIKFRDMLGGFLDINQLYDVYGLEKDVVKRTFKYYTVVNKPNINLININTANASEIAKLIYIKYGIAKRIVEYRDKNGSFTSLNDLTKIEGFPSNKTDRIKLYLTLVK